MRFIGQKCRTETLNGPVFLFSRREDRHTFRGELVFCGPVGEKSWFEEDKLNCFRMGGTLKKSDKLISCSPF